MSSATNTTDESLPAPVTPAPSRGKPDRPAVSARRSAASRANGARSRDPKSPEGKRRSSRNATRHGLTATKTLVVEGESSADYRRFEDEWLAELRPSGPIETALAEEIIHTLWRQRRLWRMEATSLDIEMDQAAELRDILGRKPPEPARRLAMAFQAESPPRAALTSPGRFDRVGSRRRAFG